jgi:hypothetical protein
MKHVRTFPSFKALEGYLLIPHELLHVAGYWLVGQQCEYRWGQPYVTPIGLMLRWKRLVGMLFPFGVFFSLATVLALLAGYAARAAVREGSFFWLTLWLGLIYLTSLYVGSTLGDLRRAYLLIVNKPWHSWTPFDIFFLPVVDWNDIRQKAAKGEIDGQQN